MMMVLLAVLLQPRILVVILDDLGTDRLQVYDEHLISDSDMPMTPNIDAIAADGMRFTNFYTSKVCSPTRQMLLTGLLPAHNCNGQAYGPGDLHEVSIPTVGQWFQDAGWATSYVGKWHVNASDPSIHDPAWPNIRGWEDFGGVRGAAGKGYYEWFPSVNGTIQPCLSAYRPEVFMGWTQCALSLKSSTSHLLFHSMSLPHRELHDPPASWVTHPVGSGDDFQTWVTMVEAADHVIGQLRASLTSQDYLFVLSDNGSPRPASVFCDWPESKGSVKEPGINVPMLALGPGIEAGSVSDDLIGAYDLAPTLADLGSVPVPPGLDGRSFTDVLFGSPVEPRPFAWIHYFEPDGDFTQASFQEHALIHEDGWKLIRTVDAGVATEELYDLSSSPPGWDGDPVSNPSAKAWMSWTLDNLIGSL